MLYKHLKNNKAPVPSKGFALLFSVLVSSLLLTIGLSIFSIALKELAISAATRQSIHAFFAADSGREYALYHDLIAGDLMTFNLNVKDPDYAVLKDITHTLVTDDSDGPYFTVTVTKTWADTSVPYTQVQTTLTAKGYNSNADDRVERAIEQTY